MFVCLGLVRGIECGATLSHHGGLMNRAEIGEEMRYDMMVRSKE